MAYQPIGDTIALCALAYNLYNDVWCSAKRAPNDVKDLLDEFDQFRNLLLCVQEQPRDEHSQAAIERCKRFLRGEFRDLCKKYEKLANAGDASRSDIVLRLRFAAHKKDIIACRTRLRELISDVQTFCTISSGPCMNYNVFINAYPGSGISPYSQLIQEGLQEHPTLPPKPAFQSRSFQSPSLSSNKFHNVRRITFPSLPALGRNFHDQTKSSTPSSTISSEDPADCNTYGSLSSETLSRRRTDSALGEAEDVTYSSQNQETMSSGSPDCKMPIITSEFLSRARLCSQGSLSSEAVIKFKDNLALTVNEREESLEHWIFLAAWWMLKAQRMREMMELASDNLPEIRYVANQVLVYLAKSYFLFHYQVLGRLELDTEISFANWVLVNDLTRTLSHAKNSDIDLHPKGKSKFSSEPYRLTEMPIQPIEEASQMPAAMDEVRSTKRWLNIDPKHAGGPDGEDVLFRTFVNAEIGYKGQVIMTDEYPYLLILALKTRGRLVVFLENQLGTVKLSKQLTDEDIHASENFHGLNEDIFEFPTQVARIRYLSAAERESFWVYPRKHMDVTVDYKPRSGEFPLFQGEIISVHSESRFPDSERTVSFHQDALADRRFAVTLYEALPEKPENYWNLTRRLAVCTPPDASKSWAASWWLPSFDIITQMSDCYVTLEYSDFKHLKGRSRDYQEEFEFTHCPDVPNASIKLRFGTISEAKDLLAYILQPYRSPFENPNIVKRLGLTIHLRDRRVTSRETAYPIQRSSDSDYIRVLNIEDSKEERPSIYSAILYTKRKHHNYRMTELTFAYQFLDFEIKPNISRIWLRHLWRPKYISDMTNMSSDPFRKGRDCNPGHKRTEQVPRDQHLIFSAPSEVADFMLALTNYRLVFCRSARLVSMKFSGVNMNTDKLEGAVVMLWTKREVGVETSEEAPIGHTGFQSMHSRNKIQPTLQVTMRSTGKTGAPWRTATIEQSIDCTLNSPKNDVLLRRIQYQVGSEINIKTMSAGKSNESRSCKLITISFADNDHMNEFDETVRRCLRDDVLNRRFTVT